MEEQQQQLSAGALQPLAMLLASSAFSLPVPSKANLRPPSDIAVRSAEFQMGHRKNTKKDKAKRNREKALVYARDPFGQNKRRKGDEMAELPTREEWEQWQKDDAKWLRDVFYQTADDPYVNLGEEETDPEYEWDWNAIMGVANAGGSTGAGAGTAAPQPVAVMDI
jgi:hypothetical protein